MRHITGTVAWAFGLSLAATVGFSSLGSYHNSLAFPPLSISLSSPVASLSDFLGIALGFRKLTADVAWVQTLLYYGTHEVGADLEAAEQGGGHYPLFLAYCERAAEIDPNFKNIFYYGSGVLGWNLNRLNEAEKLLREGIEAHPKEWRFQQFLAGLAYQKSHNISKLTEFLEGFVEQPDCPNMLRSILANIYKKQKRYGEAIRIWAMIYETGDTTYTDHALAQIKKLNGPKDQRDTR